MTASDGRFTAPERFASFHASRARRFSDVARPSSSTTSSAVGSCERRVVGVVRQSRPRGVGVGGARGSGTRCDRASDPGVQRADAPRGLSSRVDLWTSPSEKFELCALSWSTARRCSN
eukprot:31128-Pelagococcus_subviridis.AAC.1